ncbi:hypothetical protein J5J83_20900 [Azoarcus sp. L1K30]|uniref:glycosyltransferase family 2 protein n=1 Tax=Azoarcus sp. L1K30 TaxID=2820277 RepID=UPI001B8214B6|nr:glycosyltransferase family 2 protein [Azoarcus sp. L1K30]MBR0568591.1 hypothetical protein [Azoarcus sp. L1K30]
MKSVAVVFRAYDAEAPYVRSFIDHYMKIGCGEFHVVVPDGNPSALLEVQLQGYTNVRLHRDHGYSRLYGCQTAALRHVESEYTLSVDVDEFLDVDTVSSLPDCDFLELPWVIAPFNPCRTGEGVFGFVDGQIKYMVRTERCESLEDHGCVIKGGFSSERSPYPLLHYVYRSYSDLFLKCTLGSYHSYQRTIRSQLIDGVDDVRKLPLKIKMAAIYQRLSLAGGRRFPNFCAVDAEVESSLVSSSGSVDSYVLLEEAFFQYQSRIDLVALLKQVRGHPKFREYGRLPHFVLAEIADRTLCEPFRGEDWLGRRRSGMAERMRALFA